VYDFIYQGGNLMFIIRNLLSPVNWNMLGEPQIGQLETTVEINFR
jgi:hypothetical protein